LALSALAVGPATAVSAAPARDARIATAVIAPTRLDVPGSPITSAREAADPELTFVKIKPRSLANWELKSDAPDGTRFMLTPKNAQMLALPEKRVLVLFNKPSSAFDGHLSKYLDVLYGKQARVVLTLLNYKSDEKLGLAALEYAQAGSFDLVGPMGSDAAEFVHNNYRTGPIPSIGLMTKDPVLVGWTQDLERGSGTNMAYVSGAISIEVQLAYLRQLRENVRNIAVLYALSSKSTIDAQVQPLKQYASREKLNVLDVVVTDDKQAREQLAAKVPEAVAEMSRSDPGLQNSAFWVTGVTSVFDNIETISRNSAKLPVFSVYPDVVREGPNSALLSVGITYENMGYLAALYTFDALYNKAMTGQMKVGVVAPPDISVNFMKAAEIGLRVPFQIFEEAGFVYGKDGKAVRVGGQNAAR
jgi:putative ABC transport system substrate-binding protein